MNLDNSKIIKDLNSGSLEAVHNDDIKIYQYVGEVDCYTIVEKELASFFYDIASKNILSFDEFDSEFHAPVWLDKTGGTEYGYWDGDSLLEDKGYGEHLYDGDYYVIEATGEVFTAEEFADAMSIYDDVEGWIFWDGHNHRCNVIDNISYEDVTDYYTELEYLQSTETRQGVSYDYYSYKNKYETKVLALRDSAWQGDGWDVIELDPEEEGFRIDDFLDDGEKLADGTNGGYCFGTIETYSAEDNFDKCYRAVLDCEDYDEDKFFEDESKAREWLSNEIRSRYEQHIEIDCDKEFFIVTWSNWQNDCKAPLARFATREDAEDKVADYRTESNDSATQIHAKVYSRDEMVAIGYPKTAAGNENIDRNIEYHEIQEDNIKRLNL